MEKNFSFVITISSVHLFLISEQSQLIYLSESASSYLFDNFLNCFEIWLTCVVCGLN